MQTGVMDDARRVAKRVLQSYERANRGRNASNWTEAEIIRLVDLRLNDKMSLTGISLELSKSFPAVRFMSRKIMYMIGSNIIKHMEIGDRCHIFQKTRGKSLVDHPGKKNRGEENNAEQSAVYELDSVTVGLIVTHYVFKSIRHDRNKISITDREISDYFFEPIYSEQEAMECSRLELTPA